MVECLKTLFDSAKSSDEFEFCCTLLRVRGIESEGWDPLKESDQLIQQMLAFINAPLKDETKLRLSLLLYCHVTEMNDFYSIPANLLRVIHGDRYAINPFIAELSPHGNEAKYPQSKVNRIMELSKEAEMPEIGSLYSELLVKQVRNAFFHSDYVLYGKEFRIIRGEHINIDGNITPKIPLSWLMPKLELGINSVIELISLVMDHIHAYTEEKVVQARMGPDEGWIEAKLIIKEGYGLTGFRC